MGRELKRKEAKKNKNAKKVEELDINIKGSTIFKIVTLSLLIIVVLYYIVAIFITKEINISWSNNEQTIENNSINVANKILAKNTFNQKEEVYYVYFYNFSDADVTINNAINNSNLTIYRVDAGDAFNQNYITGEVSNPSATSLSELKVKAPTLIKIDNDRITAYYEGNNEILNFLG